jgi:UDP-glucose 4-epimerase
MPQDLDSLARPFSGQSVLVTGATGLIGQRLVSVLAEGGAEVHILSRQENAAALWSHPSVIAHVGELQVSGLLVELCRQVQSIFHLASYAPADNDPAPEENPEHLQVTVQGTENLLAAASQAGVKSFVFSSSTRAIDGRDSTYGRAKQAAEHRVMEAAGAAMHGSVVRLAPVYGFAHKGSIAQMIQAVKLGRFPPIPDFGDRRSLVHYDDAIQALLLAAVKSEANGKIYTVTDTRTYSSREIYELICKALNKPIPSWQIPYWSLKLAAWMGDLLQKFIGKPAPISTEKLLKLSSSAWFDGCDIQRELGYKPVYDLESWLACLGRRLG